MSIPDSEGQGRQPTEEELRAAYEQEIKRIRVEHVLLEHAVTMINLGMRRTGIAAGTEGERDPDQVRLAIEAIRVLLPLIEATAPEQITPLKDALSQLQMAYLRITGQAEGAPSGPGGPGPGGPAGPDSEPGAPAEGAAGPAGATPPPGAPEPGAPDSGSGGGPAQRSGRLWIPGQ